MTALKTSVISMLSPRKVSISRVSVTLLKWRSTSAFELAKFGRKQDSLHALVVKRECSEQSFPYLLSTECCAGTVFGEDGEGISAVMPEGLKSTVEQGLKNVTVVRIQSHPGVLLLVVHKLVSFGDESADTAEACQHP